MLSSNTSAANGAANYIEDVFSTWLYTGNGSTQTITNGIDLAGKGGLVWIKSRQFAYNHSLTDTARGVNQGLASNTTSAQVDYSGSGGSVTAFNSTGFSLGSRTEVNDTGTNVSWTFRKQPKFFDVVTWTGDGTTRSIPHALGSVPGCIIVKNTSSAADWPVYHVATGNSNRLGLNSTSASVSSSLWGNTSPTETVFTVTNNLLTNQSGQTYVAYLFAHNAGGFGLTGTDNVISCGTYTGDGNPALINLGYEPQWLLIRESNGAANWTMFDNMRGITTGGNDAFVSANETAAENSANNYLSLEANGFRTDGADNQFRQLGRVYIYIAIRRGPMKVPTTGTSVFTPVAYTGTNVDNRLVNTGIVTDMTMARIRDLTSTGSFYTADRLRGNASLGTAIVDAETTDADSFMTPTVGYGNSFSAMNGFGVGNDATRQLNQSSTNQLAYAFRRAPGFMDVCCYTGNATANTAITHNLTTVPELIITKSRSATGAWWTLCTADSARRLGRVNAVNGFTNTGISTYFGNDSVYVAPTATAFTVGSGLTNSSGTTYVAYLFASAPGVSKVGTFTGTGATQVINCGFTGGARFVLIKAVSTTGDWLVWDSARGIVAGDDPYLELNTTDAEVTNTDWVDTAATGFELSNAGGNLANSSGVSYIFLAIA